MAQKVRTSLDEVLLHFASLEDPRSQINRKYALCDVIVIAIIAVLAGADGPTAIARWAALKQNLLTRMLSLPQGVPSKDVFRRVLMAIQPDAFQLCFHQWLNALQQAAIESTGVEQPVLSIDGKALRRSHDRSKGLGALHSVSVWCSDAGLTLAQVMTDEKSNEITAIPEVLRLVDTKGAIITIDAMGTQTAIADQIIQSDGDYILTLKGNQPGLSGCVRAYAEHHAKTDFQKIEVDQYMSQDKGHGRVERREVTVFAVPDDLPGQERWSGLRSIGIVTLTSTRKGKQSCETRYFISSLAPDAKQLGAAVRGHWGIENTCHWSLDMTYREDESRIRGRHLGENFAWLNRFTLSLLKQHPQRDSLKGKRQSCGWNECFLLEVLTGQGA